MIGHRDYATLRLNISQTFYPVGALMGIVLGKYLLFQECDSLESQLAGMNARLMLSASACRSIRWSTINIW